MKNIKNPPDICINPPVTCTFNKFWSRPPRKTLRNTPLYEKEKEKEKRKGKRKGKRTRARTRGKGKGKEKGKGKGTGTGTGKGKIFLKVRKNMLKSLDIYIYCI
jgi:hypothetical protein